jgi:hypothetical protein
MLLEHLSQVKIGELLSQQMAMASGVSLRVNF